jgi:hypothetical protein
VQSDRFPPHHIGGMPPFRPKHFKAPYVGSREEFYGVRSVQARARGSAKTQLQIGLVAGRSLQKSLVSPTRSDQAKRP